MTPLRNAALISSIEISCSLRYFSAISSLKSAAASTISLRISSTRSTYSAGTSDQVTSAPILSSENVAILRVNKSIIPLKFSDSPTGNCIARARPLSFSFTSLTTWKKFAPTRSILFAKMIRGTL